MPTDLNVPGLDFFLFLLLLDGLVVVGRVHYLPARLADMTKKSCREYFV